MRKFNVLIVDDNIYFSSALKFLLLDACDDKINFIKIVNNGNECIEELKNNLYDIVFMDVDMPEKNGIETTKEITNLYRNLYVIAISFHSEMEYVVKMIEAGARNYLVKDELTRENLNRILSFEYNF